MICENIDGGTKFPQIKRNMAFSKVSMIGRAAGIYFQIVALSNINILSINNVNVFETNRCDLKTKILARRRPVVKIVRMYLLRGGFFF